MEQENELLLLQLHQVQEELEEYYLKYQATEEFQGQVLQQLTRERDAQNQVARRTPGAVAQLTKERDGQTRSPKNFRGRLHS